jgi:hypothetical protein
MILAIVTRDPAQPGVPVATWSPCRLRASSPPLAAERFGEAKLAVLLRVAATMISWTSLWSVLMIGYLMAPQRSERGPLTEGLGLGLGCCWEPSEVSVGPAL